MVVAKDESGRSDSLRLDPNPEASRHARRALEKNLADWGMIELLDDASIVTGELVANAAREGDAFTLDLTASDSTLMIEVTDRSKKDPVIKAEYGDCDAEEGRGLFLVDAIADDWGFRRTGERKTVWARVGAARADARTDGECTQVTVTCSIRCLRLSARTEHSLRWNSECVETVGELIELIQSDMLKYVRDIGPVRIEEIRTALVRAGFQAEPHSRPKCD